MSLYRCSECRHGRNLTAWSQACAYGPLGSDGELDAHHSVEDCFVFVDSIECAVHPDARIETKIGSRFHVWSRCDKCKGSGQSPFRTYGCEDCGGHRGTWTLPLSAAVPESSDR